MTHPFLRRPLALAALCLLVAGVAVAHAARVKKTMHLTGVTTVVQPGSALKFKLTRKKKKVGRATLHCASLPTSTTCARAGHQSVSIKGVGKNLPASMYWRYKPTGQVELPGTGALYAHQGGVIASVKFFVNPRATTVGQKFRVVVAKPAK